MTETSIYTSGAYLENNAGWHEIDSPAKAGLVTSILARNSIAPGTICDIGCGAGEVLRGVLEAFPKAKGVGYDVSPQAHAIAAPRAGPKLKFVLGQAFDSGEVYDLAMAMDVFEHVDDYLGFLRGMRRISRRQIYHIPLDLSVQGLIRGSGLRRARDVIGHLHYFTKDTALATLRHTGHRVVDWRYTTGDPATISAPLRRMAALPRRLGMRLFPDFAATMLGGYSLIVLCD